MTVDEMAETIVKRITSLHENPKSETPHQNKFGTGQVRNPKQIQSASRRTKSKKSLNSQLSTLNSIVVLAPVVRGRKGEYYQMLYDFYNSGYSQVRVDGKLKNLSERITLSRYKAHTIELEVDKVPIGWPIEGNKPFRTHLVEAIENGLKHGNGAVTVVYENGEEQIMSAKFSCPDDGFAFPEIEPRLFSFNSPYGACELCHGLGKESFFIDEPCPKCRGLRLRDESLSVKIMEKNIVDLVSLTIDEAHGFISGLEQKLAATEFEIAEPAIREIKNRLKFMLDVGLDYLTLDRAAGTLSGGEAQRIRLASQVGSRLTGALYVLDEPTIGLHQRDNARLIETLEHLRGLGNTIIVVEHDEDTISAADYLVDIGPGAGAHGGSIVAIGDMPKLLDSKKDVANSITLQYLLGKKKIPVPESRRKHSRERIKITGAEENNLKKIDVEIPLRRLISITGVSGSGKSSLMNDVLFNAASNKINGTSYRAGKHKSISGLDFLDKVIVIDQSPIGRTPRSNPATYTGAWTYIRELFAATPEARMRGWKVGRFSFNVAGGRCEHCEGNGTIAIEMHFLPTVYVKCDICKGKRFANETLEIAYKGKTIYDALKMTVEEAAEFFRDIPFIYQRLKILREVGLDYLELGQSATTLSGGEAQRIKLGAELARRSTGRTLYLLDEPTVGLHYDDVKKLIEVLERLVKAGNTVLVIEHNLDVIKCSDYIIDLGPEGGLRGGEVVAVGTPEEVARNANSYTGGYLKKVLK
ncbi:excinuclease ABC subunit UvrA [Candidatus Uhrbacteria bacterium]|nr:excinuclease ABC subunit UvrA [Candidatus Uhrbacteria bacterium]